MKLQENLEHLTKRAGLYLAWDTSGDGMTSYRFFRTPSDYYGPETAFYTAVGIDEALVFILGVNIGLDEARRRIMKEVKID